MGVQLSLKHIHTPTKQHMTSTSHTRNNELSPLQTFSSVNSSYAAYVPNTHQLQPDFLTCGSRYSSGIILAQGIGDQIHTSPISAYEKDKDHSFKESELFVPIQSHFLGYPINQSMFDGNCQ